MLFAQRRGHLSDFRTSRRAGRVFFVSPAHPIASACAPDPDRRLAALAVRDARPQCTLLVYIDDATSRLMHLQFVETESTFDYFEATPAYLERYGKPIAFYSDKHAVFRVNKKDAAGGNGMTQFGALCMRSTSTSSVPIPRRPRAAWSGRTGRCRTAW